MVKLYNKATNQEIRVGDIVKDFRGNELVVTSLIPYYGMYGKVELDNMGIYYPSVINSFFDFDNKISA